MRLAIRSVFCAIPSRATESRTFGAKSMLNSPALRSASQLSSSEFSPNLSLVGSSNFKDVLPASAKRAVKSPCLCGRHLLQVQARCAADTSQHKTYCTSAFASHDNRRTYAETLTSRLHRRLAPATSMQILQASAAQQESYHEPRAHQQAAGAAAAILPQADDALHPFLVSSSEQPTRAQVDYSKGQRPLQVLSSYVNMSHNLRDVLHRCKCVRQTVLACVSAVEYPSVQVMQVAVACRAMLGMNTTHTVPDYMQHACICFVLLLQYISQSPVLSFLRERHLCRRLWTLRLK